MSIILAIIGCIIDSIFCTIFLYCRKPFKGYVLLAGIVAVMIFVSGLFELAIEKQILIFICIAIVSMFFSKLQRLNVILFVIVPFIFIGAISSYLIELIDYGILFYIAIWCIQLFFIFLPLEAKSFKPEKPYLVISLKIVLLISIIALLGLSKYYNEWEDTATMSATKEVIKEQAPQVFKSIWWSNESDELEISNMIESAMKED